MALGDGLRGKRSDFGERGPAIVDHPAVSYKSNGHLFLGVIAVGIDLEAVPFSLA